MSLLRFARARAWPQRPSRARMILLVGSTTALARARGAVRRSRPLRAARRSGARCPCPSASASGSSTTCEFGKLKVGSGTMEVAGRPGRARPRDLAHRVHACAAATSSTASTTATRAGSTRAPATRCASSRTRTRAAATSSAPSRSFPSARSSPRTARTGAAERAQPARRRLVPLLPAHHPARRRRDVQLRALLPPRSQPGDDPGAAPRAHPRARRRVRRDRRPADHQVEGHLLGERARRDLAFGRREPHHAADEVGPVVRIPQPVPQIVPSSPGRTSAKP